MQNACHERGYDSFRRAMTDTTFAANEASWPNLPAALAAHAAAFPEDPWLFYRDRWDWQWRSWSQVADQVARAAAALRRATGPRIGFDARPGPDAVAVELAVRAVGLIAVPVAGADCAPDDSAQAPPRWDGWAEVGEAVASTEGDTAPARIRLPAVRSRLARWTPEAIASAGPAEEALWRSAARFAESLPALTGRPIVLASSRVDRAVVSTLLAWILKSGAAWVLEPEPEGFVPAVLRTRPTLVLAPSQDLDLLALAMDSGTRRRWSRLQAAVVTDEAAMGAEDRWRRVGASVIRFPSVEDATPE